MRKNLILSAMAFAALAFAGCSQDDTLKESPAVNQAIEFGTYVGRDAVSRAEDAAALAKIKTTGFGVYAYYTGQENFATYYTNVITKPAPNFMYNQKVAWGKPSGVTTGDDYWYYSPIKYWPNNEDDKVSFVAYAPHNSDDANVEIPTDVDKKAPVIKFTVNNTVKNQSDLLLSKRKSEKNIDLTKRPVGNTDDCKVKFEFTHALARIGFSVTGAFDQVAAGGTLADGTTITIEKVILSDAAYTKSGSTYTDPNTGDFYTSGKVNVADGSWSDKIDGQCFTLTSDNFKKESDVIQNVLSKDKQTISQLNADDSYLMVIPQSLTDLWVNIQYKVTTADGNLENGKSEITNYISKKIDSFIFEAGKAYTFNLILGMSSVKVTASVQGWTVITPSTDVDLPENKTPTTGA